ncbi:hypothetical protein [Spiroplasma endosymbiont of Villa modesta]|uniref:hypothetical protein n=1 Tax=Spiroplasma endosymbiont of Villa modesta TaxID=3066293 RepID=UPI00313D4522
MENKNNIDWNVNLNYITKDDLKTIYGFIPDADQTTTDNTKTDFTIMAIAISSERINTITGNQIEVIGFKNLNETQQQLVKRATARMTIYYLTDGMAFIRSSVSISGNGLSSSISPPSEPDYVLMEVYNLLQQANLHTPRKAINNPISCNTDNFNTPSIFDESDTKLITWDSGNKTFLQKMSLIEGTGIKIDNVSDTIPKLKIHVDSNIDSLWEVDKDNINFVKLKDDKGIIANNKRIIDVGTPTFETDATNKEYVDNKIPDLTNYYKKSVFMKGYFTYKDDRDQLWINDSSNSSLAISLLLNNTYGRLETNNKNIVGAINEINKKQVKENWKIIGKSINNRKYGDFNLAFNTLYRVIITWESPPFHQVNTRITVEFKTGNYLGGIHGSKIFLTKGLINNEEGILYLQLLDINKWQLILEGGNEKYANIFSLEELQNTVKVDIIQPIKITSHTLKINELKNNEINIELPNTPTPSPSIPQWKEVGEVITDKNNNNQNFIKYIFKDKTHYRIYISYGDYTSKENNKNYSWQIINFYYQLDTSVVKSSLWIANNNNNQQTEINIYNNRIMWGMGRDYIFKKLEELQE